MVADRSGMTITLGRIYRRDKRLVRTFITDTAGPVRPVPFPLHGYISGADVLMGGIGVGIGAGTQGIDRPITICPLGLIDIRERLSLVRGDERLEHIIRVKVIPLLIPV